MLSPTITKSCPRLSLTQVCVLLLAELSPLSEAEVELIGIVGVVVAAPDGLAGVILVAEPHEAVIVPEFRIRSEAAIDQQSWHSGDLPVIPIVKGDFVDGPERFEPLPEVGPRRALPDAAHVDDPHLPVLDIIGLAPPLLLKLGHGLSRRVSPQGNQDHFLLATKTPAHLQRDFGGTISKHYVVKFGGWY